MPAVISKQADFYRGFLMARGNFNPADFGVNLTREQFTEEMAEDFSDAYRGTWTIDELLLHPREASRFCDEVRHKRGYYDMSDDLILRVIMGRRKNP